MNKLKPKCTSKCSECLFHYVDECIATPGKDYFIKINIEKAKLLLENPQSFALNKQKLKELVNHFPTLSV